jgi:hypothetical protein
MSDLDRPKDLTTTDKPRVDKNGRPLPAGFAPWVPGQSGNPSGRPKMTQEQKDMMDSIRSLGPKCYKAMETILDGNSALAKVKIVEIILSYILGKPESNIKVDISTEEKIAQSELRIAALVQSIKLGGRMSDGEYAGLGEPARTLESPAPDREPDRIPGPDGAAQRLD